MTLRDVRESLERLETSPRNLYIANQHGPNAGGQRAARLVRAVARAASMAPGVKLGVVSTFFIGQLILGTTTLAEPMPEESKQFQAVAVSCDGGTTIFYICPPEHDPDGVQVACLFGLAERSALMPAFDHAMFNSGLTPVEPL